MTKVNGKAIDMSSVWINNVNHKDYPDYVDAYVGDALYDDGTPVDDATLDKLTQEWHESGYMQERIAQRR